MQIVLQLLSFLSVSNLFDHLFGTGFIFPVNENLKNRLYCDIYFLLWLTA